MSKAIESGSNYYTLSYTPTDSKQDGGFRKIQVKLAQQGLTLNYRNGYYADEPEAKSQVKLELSSRRWPRRKLRPSANNSVYGLTADGICATHRDEGPDPDRDAGVGLPPATEILLKLQVLPARNTAVERTHWLRWQSLPVADPPTSSSSRQGAVSPLCDRHCGGREGHSDQQDAGRPLHVFDRGADLRVRRQRLCDQHGGREGARQSFRFELRQHATHRSAVPPGDQRADRMGTTTLRIVGARPGDRPRIRAVEVPVASVANLAPLAAAATHLPLGPSRMLRRRSSTLGRPGDFMIRSLALLVFLLPGAVGPAVALRVLRA